MQKVWAFKENYLLEYQTKLENITLEEKKAALDIFGKEVPESILSIEDGTAKIKIKGILSQKGPDAFDRFFGYDGTAYGDIVDACAEIMENESVTRVELLMDTPGGEVLGVDSAAQAIAELSKKKKVTAINQGLIASAGYWLASQAGEIISESAVNLTGSIGVVITAVDFKKYYENYGVRIVEIVSRNAPEKRPDIYKKSGIDALQKLADQIERVFTGRIAEGRGLSVKYVEKNFGRGNVLVAQDPGGYDAIDAKMIDAVGTAKCPDDEEDSRATTQAQKIENNPVSNAGNIKQEVLKMPTLAEFLAENPTAKAEHDILLKAEHDKGKEAGKKELRAELEKVVPYLTSEEYDGAVRQLAAKAIAGEVTPGEMIAAVTLYDARTEKEKSNQAANETEKIGDTQPGQHSTGNANGEITDEASLAAEIARMKGGA